MNVRQMWAAKLAGAPMPAPKPLPARVVDVLRGTDGSVVSTTGATGAAGRKPRAGGMVGNASASVGGNANAGVGVAGLVAAYSLQRAPFDGLVLGIDPSLRGTGLALLEFAPSRQPVLLRCRTVKIPPTRPMSYALGEIHRAVAAFLGDFKVKHVALEQTIYVQNFQTAQILGAARGAAISAAALGGLEIFEYAPTRVKQAVTGAGRASKEQMARTVMAMLGHGAVLASDEADAAGVALCHAFTWRE